MIKQSEVAKDCLYLTSLLLSSYLLFSNPHFFNWLSIEYQPVYLTYSKEILNPGHMAKVMYWGESILLPLLAHVIGASQSKMAYFYFCGLIYIAIIPTFVYLVFNRLNSPSKSFFFALLLVTSFPYIRQMDYSSPDFLTILLIGIAVLTKNNLVVFICTALATLSHFSIVLISIISVIPLIYFSPLPNQKVNNLTILYFIGGSATGRALLELWYRKFNYLNTKGRIDYVFDRGVDSFVTKFLEHPGQFWLTPQITFLLTFFLVTVYFIYKKKYGFCVASFFALFLAYVAMFFTVDGYRIFATVIAGPYCYLLLCLSSQFHPTPKNTKMQAPKQDYST